MLALANKLSLNTRPIYRFVNEHSIDFDGVDDKIVTDGADNVLQNTTYSFWCKTSESGSNTVFGHGSLTKGCFSLNYLSNKPLLGFSSNTYVYWQDVTAQDDGEWHHWVVYADATTIANCKLYIDGVLQTQTNAVNNTGYDAYTESLTIGADRQSGGNHFEGKIDEFAVYDRELTQAEITRMFNTYYSPNRVANGNFSQIGNEEVTNGDFATDSDWSKGTGITISGGSANFTGNANTFLTQSGVVSSSKTYKATFTVSNYVSGAIDINLGGSTRQGNISANGSYVFYITVPSGNILYFQEDFSNGFVGSIDNVSVKEVGQNWTFGIGWSIENGKAVCSSLSNNLTQDFGVTANRDYKVTVEVTDYTSGTLFVDLGGASAQTTSSLGNKTFNFTTSSTALLRFYGGSFRGSIDNIVVQELKHDATNLMLNAGAYQSASNLQNYYRMGDGILDGYPLIADQTNPSLGSELVTNGDFSTDSDWIKGTGWSIANGLASCDGSQSSSSLFYQNLGNLSGKIINISFTLSNYSAGTLETAFFGAAGTLAQQVSANGNYSFNIYIESGHNGNSGFTANSSFVGSIDNVSLKQVNGSPGIMTNMSASDIVLDTPNEPN